MAALATEDQLLSCIASRSQLFEFERSQTFTILGGQYVSLWLGTGFPGPGVAPGAAAVPTNATAGALAKFTDPAGGEFAHLVSIDVNVGTNAGSVELWDRLVHSGGLSGTVTTGQTINTPAITRGDTNGIGAEGFIECYTTLGSSGVTATVSYTNSAGTAGRTATVAIPANFRAGRALLISPLQGDDLAIKSIETITLSATTGTAGDFGVTIARRIAAMDTKNTSVPRLRTLLELGLSKIETDACLWLTAFSGTTNLGTVRGGLTLITTG